MGVKIELHFGVSVFRSAAVAMLPNALVMGLGRLS